MDVSSLNHARLIGHYILGSRIGSGSFAVVWRARHRQSGFEVAVKEIDRKQLSPKIRESLFKEVSILSTINHPNIIRLFESIQTEEKIYLVLEYCRGGDLAGYINRYGKISESVARHFMRQLAAGLQVLQEKHLIHRDLKPQNLLLSTNEVIPLLKIGDFGFARSLTPQNLADTLCGSPLYMAPEIIQNQKYDAKADLWSVGAILFQLVTGKLPFDGNNQYQLFQNILRCTQLQFPEGALEELHPDCVDLCRGLLCQNPVERLSFEEFFNHKFLQEPRQTMDVEQTSAPSELQLMAEQPVPFTSQGRPPLQSRHSMSSGSRNSKSSSSSIHENIVSHNHGAASSSKGFHGFMPTIAYDKIRKSVVAHCSTDQLGGVESVESIEKDYVLVDPLFASAETLSYLEASLQDIHTSILCNCPSKKIDQGSAIATGIKKITASSSDVEIPSGQQAKSSGSTFLGEVQGLTILHPSGRLYILNQYVQVLEELAQEQYKAGQCLESFSVELLVLAIWKKALQICNSWMISIKEGESPATSSAKESAINRQDPGLALYSEQRIDFHTPLSVRTWAEQGFIFAFDCAEKLSDHLRNMDANAEMPDAMEIIYRHALALGTNGAVHEYMDNKGSAAASYSKAALLLSFLVGEATTLPLNPPFLLTPDNKKRIQNYIFSLQSRQAHFLMSQTDPKQSPNSHIK